MSAAKKILGIVVLSALGYAFYEFSNSKTTPSKTNTAANPANNYLPSNSGTKTNNTAATTTSTTTPVANQNNSSQTTSSNTTQTNNVEPTITLDRNLLLKLDVIGNEVRELQNLLGTYSNSVFDSQTQSDLLARKGVREITLNQFATMPDVITPTVVAPEFVHIYNVGQAMRARAFTSSLSVNTAKVISGIVFLGPSVGIPNGQEVGTIYMKLNEGTKNDPYYLVKKPLSFGSTFTINSSYDYLKIKQSNLTRK